MKKTCLIFILLFSLTELYSQKLDSLFSKKRIFVHDTTRIKDVSDKLNIYTGLLGKIHTIELNNTEINKKLIYEPNGKTSVNLGFSYKWLGLGVSFSPEFMNKDNEIYGETESFDAQFNIYSRAIGVDAYLQYYKGFYLKNPGKFVDWQNDAFPMSPDLKSYSFGLSAYYFFNNKRFSYKAAFTRNQIQKKSAGAFILGAYISANVASTPEGFIPQELPDSLSTYYGVDAYTTSSTGVSFGYTYTLVFLKRFFINATLVPGIGYRNAEFWDNGISTKQEGNLTIILTARAALGYEGKHLYAGITLVSASNSYNYESVAISSSTGNIRLFIGNRFNVKKRSK